MPVKRLHEHGDVVVLRTTLPLKTGQDPGGLIHFCPDRVPQRPDVLFLANGFSANHKTFTFRARLPHGGYADSMADYLAKWGYIAVVKDVGSDRMEIEPTFDDHIHHVPHYAETVLRVVDEELPQFCNRKIKLPKGVHWIGHSMGGMEVMGAPNRDFILSLTTISSPTYMHTEEAHTMRLAQVFGGVLGVRDRYRRVPVSAGLLSKVTDAAFKAMGVESGRDLTREQAAVVRAVSRAPFVNMIVHNFLNMDHLDLETAVAFFRTGLSDESLHLMTDFAQALLKGREGEGTVLGRTIPRVNMPVLILSGRGDHIAPTESCETLLDYVDHAFKRSVSFEQYDHLGLLVRLGAEDHVWPHVVLFLHEQKLRGSGARVAAAREARKAALFLLDNLALGIKARNHARGLLELSDKIIERNKSRKESAPKN